MRSLGVVLMLTALGVQVGHAQPEESVDGAEAEDSAEVVDGVEGESAEPDAAGQATTEARFDEQLDQAARLTFQTARDAFLNGRYEEALERFQQAYRLSPRPMLLYNIAATLDRLRRDEETVVYLRRYLDESDNAPDQTEVEARIRVLERAIAERRPAPQSEPEPQPDPEPETEPEPAALTPTPAPVDEGSDGLHWAIFAGVGGAAVVAGALVLWSGLDAVSTNDDFEGYVGEAGATGDVAEGRFDDVRSAERRTNALIGVAAGLGAAAVALAVFTDWGGSEDASAPEVTASAGPEGFYLGATRRF